jgi:hypothetical protein
MVQSFIKLSTCLSSCALIVCSILNRVGLDVAGSCPHSETV